MSGFKVNTATLKAPIPTKRSTFTPPVTTPPDLVNKAGKLWKHTFSAGIRNIMTGK